MNNKNKQTLRAIYTDPIPADIKWNDIENLIKDLGGIMIQGQGSRIRFKLGNIKATFHRPHPQPETNKSTIKDIRRFLLSAGVIPE